MPDESVNAIITDPPYGINYVSQTGARIKNDKAPFIWFLLPEVVLLLSPQRSRGGGSSAWSLTTSIMKKHGGALRRWSSEQQGKAVEP